MDSQEGCLRKRTQCQCFCECTRITDKEFYKIFELEDTGVALYRYVPVNQDPENTIGEVYVLRTNDDVELEPDEFTSSFAKNKINCPRCIKLIEKAEKSLTGRPLIKQQDIAGICDHCWRPVTKMQRLLELAKRKERKQERKVTAAVEAMKTQMEQVRGADEDKVPEEVKEKVPEEVKERPTTPKLQGSSKTTAQDEKAKAKEEKNKVSELQSRDKASAPTAKLKDKSKTKAGDQTAEKQTPIPEKAKANEEKSKIKQKTSVDQLKPEKAKANEEKSKIKQKSSVDQLKPEKAKANEEKSKIKQKSSVDQLKPEKAKANEEKSKIKQKSSVDQLKPEKAKANEEKSKIKQKFSLNQLKEQIAQEKLKKAKVNQDKENRRKEEEKQRKLADLAEKKGREAELQHSAKAKTSPPKLELPHDSDSDEHVPGHGDAAYQALAVNDIVIGEKICKNIRRGQSEQLDTSEKKSTKKLKNSGNPGAVESERGKGPDISKNGPVVDVNKHEKEAAESGRGDKKLALETEKHEKKPLIMGTERTESPKKGKVIDDKIKEGLVGTQSPKYATKSDAPTKVPIVGAEKVEMAPIKSTHDQQKKKEEGPVCFALSDRTFIEKGWTMLPVEKVVRKMNVYRMRPSRPEFDWFEHHKNRVLEYDTGERLAEVDDSGRGRWYYRSGALAMDYYDAEETKAGQRFVVYSSGAPDARGRPRPRTVLAAFDHSGSGVVFDHDGKPRLKYNQTEGIVLDRKIGPVSRWKWHTLNDPPVLQQIMMDTQLNHKDPKIAQMSSDEQQKIEDEAMLSIELDNFVKEKTKKSSQDFKPFQIKMKALKINENFSLRVLDQASIYLLYRDGLTNLKINIGMQLDHREIVDTDTSEIGEVPIKVEKLPAYTASISELQQAVARARACAAEERERRARLTGRPEGGLSNSVDALRAAISRPVRTNFFTCSVTATQDTPKLLKPCSCDFYCKQRS